MKHKKIMISGIVALAILILAFTGYVIYHYSTMFRNLSDNSPNGVRGEELRTTGQEALTGDGMVPEEIQNTGLTVTEVESLPTYEYAQQEIEVYNDGQKIYGIAYIPDTGAEKVPLVICAHGLGGSYRSNLAYAEQLALHGIAAYCFDFRGGGGNRSDGDTTEMSVMTEVSDLEAILSAASDWDFVDSDEIVLLGTSQGGITSAIAAARHTDEIKGLVLMYPAFLVGDAVHEQFASLEEVPDSFPFKWITAGRPYVEDMWDYDVYEEIGNYTDKVLLMHGSADSIVPISYSERAAEAYEDVEYYVIDGAGHGFNGGDFDEAIRYIFDYLQQIEIIPFSESTGTFEYEIQELYAWRDDNQIYGVVYIPQMEDKQMPAVIYAHGYGATHQNGIQYAEKLAERGFVVYCFDFCGGSEGSQSDGSPLEMSIFTEQADLEAVIDMMRELDYVDSDKVFLFGASQGGLVSGITAAANGEKLQGLILLYPAFEMVETVQEMFSNTDEIPESYHFLWMTVGRRYFEDIQNYDVYDVIRAYDKDVLLIHGDSDGIVPLSSSERALEVYPSAELKILPGAGHGLYGQDAEKTVEYMLEYLQEHIR